MSVDLEPGAVVEVQLAKSVLVGVVISSGTADLWIEMDGRLDVGMLVAILDPSADRRAHGKVITCQAWQSEGYRLHIERTALPVINTEPVISWPAVPCHSLLCTFA